MRVTQSDDDYNTLNPSAAIRSGPPVDKKEVSKPLVLYKCGIDSQGQDIQDAQLTGQVWAGVVPIHKVMGEPQSAEYSRIPPPEHIFQL